MGRIKTQLTKRIALKLVEKNPDKFKDNFNENKVLIKDVVNIPSLKLRNTIIGYITRLVKSKR